MLSIRFSSVSVTYPGDPSPIDALGGVDLDIESGEPVAVIGPSGCGKSTLLLLAAGLLRPTSGSVIVDGIEIASPRSRTSLILQDFGLLPWKRALENAELGLRIAGVARDDARDRTMAALESVGISDFARSFPAELSGGMRQRLALARALATDADIMLMDEPLSALDALNRERMQDLLLDLWRRRGHTQVIVTHSVDEAVFLGRRVFVLSERPGTVAHTVDNPSMGSPDHRATDAFHEACTTLRSMLGLGTSDSAGARAASLA